MKIKFQSKNFGDLFDYLTIERNLIPLGLYRLPGACDNTAPYTYTNPPEDVKNYYKYKKFLILG